MNESEELLRFIGKSPVSFQAVLNIKEMLLSEKFIELSEAERWDIVPGKSYFTIRNDSAIIAFTVPEEFQGIHIVASHCDSPYFKLKENPEMEQGKGYIVLNVERYGGMLMYPWFDRPLSVAGRIYTKNGSKLVKNFVDFDKDMLMIPSLAIHMDRDANDKKKINPQEELLPLYGLADEKKNNNKNKKSIIAKAAELIGEKQENVMGYDLFVYNHERGMIWGEDGEFISAPRLDDLQCAYTTLKGFIEGNKKKRLSMYVVFDNEEVGSSTRQGAASTFLKDTLERVYTALGRDSESYHIDLANGFMISADNAHAVHPNYASKADPVNRPIIDKGVVLKFSGNQKYCTDGYSAAFFRNLCEKAGCNVQAFANRSDIPGGSTLGNISNNQVPIATADIGLPQLAMHSPFETAGTKDTEDMIKITKEFFE